MQYNYEPEGSREKIPQESIDRELDFDILSLPALRDVLQEYGFEYSIEKLKEAIDTDSLEVFKVENVKVFRDLYALIKTREYFFDAAHELWGFVDISRED